MINYRQNNCGFVSSVLKWNWLILLIWLTGFAFFAFCLIRFLFTSAAPVDNSVSIWFQQDDPELVKYEKFNKDFGEAEWTMMVLKTKSIREKNFLVQLEELTEEIESVPHVQKVVSLANSKSPAMDGRLYRSGDDCHTVMLIKNDNLIRKRTKYRVALLDSIRTLTEAKPGITGHALAGTTVINAELNRAAEHDAVIFYILVSGLLFLFALITLKNLRDGIVLIAIVTGTIIPVMGSLAFFEIPYNLITIMLPTLLMAFSVADIVHVIDLFHKIKRSGSASIEQSLESTVRQLWKPGLWTSLSTAAGLVALSRSDVIPILQLGIMGPVGILLALLQTMTIGPILLNFLWRSRAPLKSPGETEPQKKGWYQNLIDWMTALNGKNPRKLVTGFIIMVLPVLALPWLEVDTNYAEFFRSHSRVPVDYNKVKEAKFFQNPLSIQLSVHKGKKITSPGVYAKIRRFEEKVESLTEVSTILSATPLLSEIHKILSQQRALLQDSNWEQIGMEKILQAAEVTGKRDLDDFILPNLKQIQIMAMTDYLSSKELMKVKNNIQKAASAAFNHDEVSVLVTGSTTLWASMDKHISKTQLQSILFIFCFMALFLPIIFKSLRLGMLGLIINFHPISVALGVMALSGIKVNIATALIGSTAFGVVVDDTIHFITRLKNNMKEGLTLQESIAETLEVIGHSIITTTLILVGSFISLSSSAFLPISHFGIFIALSVSLALYLDIFILPLLVRHLYCKESSI